MTLAPLISASSMRDHRQEVAPATGQTETSAHKRLRKAAEEFEGILISKMLDEFKTGFSSIGGDSPMAGSDTLNSLAIQTLSGAMARQGGLGIGKMLLHRLEPSLNRGPR
jgi:Rod binding domain-containing protein